MGRSIQVSDVEGPAATAVRHARQGHETVVTANGEVVARIGPGDDIRMGHGKPRGLARRVRLRGGGSAADDIIEQRR